MTHYPPILLAALLCLSGCNEPAPPAPAAPPVNTAATLKGAAVTDPKSVPPAFRAIWTVSDCDEPYETLEIAIDAITIEENRAPVASVEATGPDEILIAVIPGGGRQRTFRYRLTDGGENLFDVRTGLTRSRCPAA